MTLDYSRRPRADIGSASAIIPCQRRSVLNHHPRYEVNGDPSDGEEAVRKLLQGWIGAFPDLHLETVRLRHMDDGVLVEGLITGTHDGDWAGIPPTGRRVEVPAIGIFEFDEDRLLCEKVYLDMVTVLTQIGVLPAIS
jgi:steroid delta-isomerase-like uncharacterized protein